MGKIYEMKLNPSPFERMANGSKTFEYRLCDEKRSKLVSGDMIIFSRTDQPDEKLIVSVIDIYRERSFTALRTLLCNKGYIDYNDLNPTAMQEYYSLDQQMEHGVVGIRIHLIAGDEPIKKLKSDYEKEYDECSYVVVSDYIVEYIFNHRIREDQRVCGFASTRWNDTVGKKIRGMFTEPVLDGMAYLIRYKRGEISEEGLKLHISPHGRIRKKDVETLLEDACNFHYDLPGILSKSYKGFLD